MGSMVELDEAIDNLGYLRLSTVKRYTRHLGNVLSSDVIDEAREMGFLINNAETQNNAIQGSSRKRRRKRHWLLHMPGGRRILSAIYDRIYKILYS